MVFAYNPAATDVCDIVCRCSKSVIPLVLASSSFWVMLVLHITLSLLQHLHTDDYDNLALQRGLAYLRSDHIAVISSVSFLSLVFYVQVCYTRYQLSFDAVQEVFKRSEHFLFVAFTYLKECGSRKHVCMVLRWMRLSIVLLLLELRNGDQPTPHEWDMVVLDGALDAKERGFLEHLTGTQRYLVLQRWMSRAILAGFTRPGVCRELCNQIEAFDEAQIRTLTLVKIPVPFEYFHLTSISVLITLALWACAMAISASVWGLVVYMLVEFVLIGILELANTLTHPFGDDEVDFPLRTWLNDCIELQDSLLYHDYCGAEDDFQQSLNRQNRANWREDMDLLLAVRGMYSGGSSCYECCSATMRDVEQAGSESLVATPRTPVFGPGVVQSSDLDPDKMKPRKLGLKKVVARAIFRVLPRCCKPCNSGG